MFIYLNTNIMFTIITIAFLSLGLINNINYYRIDYNNKFSGKVQVVEEKTYSKIVSFKGKRFYLQELDPKYSLGDNVYIEGELIEGVDKDKGILGTLKVQRRKF